MSISQEKLRTKNHYLPESYLTSWAVSESKVFVYRTLVHHINSHLWQLKHPGATGYVKNLYIRYISGKESDEDEKWFDREFESPVKSSIEKVIRENILSPKDWKLLINFLAVQDVRTPTRLIQHYQTFSKELPIILNGIMDDLPKKLAQVNQQGSYNRINNDPFSDIQLKITTDLPDNSDKGTISATSYIGRSSWIFTIKHLLKNTSNVLHKHKWSIIKPAAGYKWPTSDNPVLKINFDENGNYDLNGGWGVQNGVIFFPLDPDHAMFVQIGAKPFIKNTRLDVDFTKLFIKLIAENAFRDIYSTHESADIEKYRPRVINAEQCKKEKLQFDKWHIENLALEKEFSKTP